MTRIFPQSRIFSQTLALAAALLITSATFAEATRTPGTQAAFAVGPIA
jgi:hypothetical protein